MTWFDRLSRKMGFHRPVTGSNEDSVLAIAEDFGVAAAAECQRLQKELAEIVGEDSVTDVRTMLFFAVQTAAQALRTQFPGRDEKADEPLARIAIGQFIFSLKLDPDFDRGALFDEMLAGFMHDLPSQIENLAKLHAEMGAGNRELMYTYMITVSAALLGEEVVNQAIINDKDRMIAIARAVSSVWINALGRALKATSKSWVSVPDSNRGIAFALPSTWRCRQSNPHLYYDLSTPQYNLLVTVLPTRPGRGGSPDPAEFMRDLLSEHPMAREACCEVLSESRVLGRYRTSVPENGLAKDDHHWLLLEVQPNAVRAAGFTLSVLAERANSRATAALSESLGARIAGAVFLDS